MEPTDAFTKTFQALNLQNKHFKDAKRDAENQIKHSLLCGRDQTIYRLIDLFEGLSDADIASFTWDLTPSQNKFIFAYCRKIFNGIAFLQGPAGSGKTMMIKVLVEIAHKRGLKVAIVTDSNAAADNVIDTIADKAYVAVRPHSLGLKRRHLLKKSDSDSDDDGDEDDATGVAAHDATTADGWKDDVMSILFSDSMLKAAQENHENAKSDDPRTNMLDSSLWTWILKTIGVIEKQEDAHAVNAILEGLALREEWKDLRGLFLKSQNQELDSAEWSKYGQLINECAASFVKDAACAIVCTIGQLAVEWGKGLKFDWIIIDEAPVITEGQFVMSWRNFEVMLLVGDQAQLGPDVLSKPDENPFHAQLLLSPFVRFISNGWPYSMLTEVMRMTAGLEIICSELFYEGQLEPGKHTSLDDASRAMSRIWQEKILSCYPCLQKEPPGLVYPIFFNIMARSRSERESTAESSRINLYNISAVVDHIIWVVESGIARPDQIGIATPSEAQVSYYDDIFDRLLNDKPDHSWQFLRTGTTRWWAGKQADYMVVDLVRAENDVANLGTLSEGRHLNVLLSRQKQAIAIFGDRKCIKTKKTRDETVNDRLLKECKWDNRKVIKMFDWMQEKGRHVEIPARSLSQKYVKLQPI